MCLFRGCKFEQLVSFAKKLGSKLTQVENQYSHATPTQSEQAELTIISEQVRLGSIQEESFLLQSPSNSWRLYVDKNSGLNASPLFRSMWIKPMPKSDLIKNLRPLKMYLQTAGVFASDIEIEELTRELFKAGVQRVRVLGEMLDSYIGEPHDGVYALERYCQKISFLDGAKRELMENKYLSKFIDI